MALQGSFFLIGWTQAWPCKVMALQVFFLIGWIQGWPCKVNGFAAWVDSSMAFSHGPKQGCKNYEKVSQGPKQGCKKYEKVSQGPKARLQKK